MTVSYWIWSKFPQLVKPFGGWCYILCWKVSICYPATNSFLKTGYSRYSTFCRCRHLPCQCHHASAAANTHVYKHTHPWSYFLFPLKKGKLCLWACLQRHSCFPEAQSSLVTPRSPWDLSVTSEHTLNYVFFHCFPARQHLLYHLNIISSSSLFFLYVFYFLVFSHYSSGRAAL